MASVQKLTGNPNIHMETQGTRCSQNHLEKKRTQLKVHVSRFENFMQNSSNQGAYGGAIGVDTWVGGTESKVQK